MAMTREEKMRALELYAAGLTRSAIAKQLGRPDSTIMRWYERGEPVDLKDGKSHPHNWDEARQAFEKKARSEIFQRLEEDRVKLSTTHFKDFETLRSMWRGQFLQKAKDADGKPIVVGHDNEGRPQYLMERRDDLTPKDVQSLAQAYRHIQEGQVKVFGDGAYTGKEEGENRLGLPPDIDKSLIERLEEAIDSATEDDVEEGDALATDSGG